MPEHFLIYSRDCVLCFNYVEDGVLVTEQGGLICIRDRHPVPACPGCKKGPGAFLAHDFCIQILQRIEPESKVETSLWSLGKALYPYYRFGITEVEFRSSIKSITSRQQGRRWVYTIPFSDTLHITPKGIFLQRIDITAVPQRRIIWDSPKALALETTVANTRIGDTVFVHYIPLHSTNGIFLVFFSLRLCAIVGYDAALAHYPKAASNKDEATWVHSPLRKGSERILEIWSIKHTIPKSKAFIIKTNLKLVWLGPAFLFETPLEITPVSLQPCQAVCFGVNESDGDVTVTTIAEEGSDKDELDKQAAETFENPQWGCFRPNDAAGNSYLNTTFSTEKMPEREGWDIFPMTVATMLIIAEEKVFYDKIDDMARFCLRHSDDAEIRMVESDLSFYLISSHGMESLPYHGSTSNFYRFDSGTVLKSPLEVWEGNSNRERPQAESEAAIRLEGQILQRWVLIPESYLGPHTDSEVIHSDLKPENYLVHATDGSSLDLWLCDFGGSTCPELGDSVAHMPDDPFFDIRMP
ncbi:kinase-like protein [Venturia nashicola]|nr:kinase-like protein [Venturia nashicola]